MNTEAESPINPEPLIQTIKEKCRMCYTCVRECPAKAIRIAAGQAEVIDSRCIGCGNCVRVCSQQAKTVRSAVVGVQQILTSKRQRAALLAPSFPAEFGQVEANQLVGMLRKMGFDVVVEVAAGADQVAQAYQILHQTHPDKRFISTSCPALVSYIKKYHPLLTPLLAPLVSPMIATARILHQQYGSDLACVFIGPCLAKKNEANEAELRGEIAAVLTFRELRELFISQQISREDALPSEFDPPHPSLGMLFPISHGMLQAAGLQVDLLSGEVVAADGRFAFVEAIKEFEEGALQVNLLEVLCCNGCIMGAGMTSTAPLFRRRDMVSRYARACIRHHPGHSMVTPLSADELKGLRRSFQEESIETTVPDPERLQTIMHSMGKMDLQDELNCGACGYDTCREHAKAILMGLAETEMCLPHTIERLRETIANLAHSNQQLDEAYAALMQSERLASMGQLAMGIAHEVNNPLGVILLYANLVQEKLQNHSQAFDDLSTVIEEAERCKQIVSGLLDFARQQQISLKPTRLAQIIDRQIAILSRPPAIAVQVIHRDPDLIVPLDETQFIQVLTNLFTNAFDAMPRGGTITITTSQYSGWAMLEFRDNGIGIPREYQSRIFEPFFTTKATNKGTGLGLAVTYGIIKMHRGKIQVISNAEPQEGATGATFIIQLPLDDSRSGLSREQPYQEDHLN